jgi:hypothetical protein
MRLTYATDAVLGGEAGQHRTAVTLDDTFHDVGFDPARGDSIGANPTPAALDGDHAGKLRNIHPALIFL